MLVINAEQYAIDTGYPLDINLFFSSSGTASGIGLQRAPSLDKRLYGAAGRRT